MATVTGLTAARMIEMENATVIAGEVIDGELILETRDGTLINAGVVEGPVGPAGGGFTVCTSSTRPSWTIAEEGKAIYETDTDIWRMWNGSAFKIQERLIRTSTTRPTLTAGDEGVTLYETDTDLEYVWTGTAWFLSNSYIVRYADASARASAWPSPPNGAQSVLANAPGVVWIYESGRWYSTDGIPGEWKGYIGDTAPPNWVLMYGQTITNAQTLYPTLWANVASGWKSGSNLIVPDYRGRVPAGKDNMGGTAANRLTVSYAGFNATLLSPSGAGGDQRQQGHNHTLHDPQHGHFLGDAVAGTGFIDFAGGGRGVSSVTVYASTGIYIDAYGDGNAQNVQPTIITNYILKIL